jgi:hypothetical protein
MSNEPKLFHKVKGGELQALGRLGLLVLPVGMDMAIT